MSDRQRSRPSPPRKPESATREIIVPVHTDNWDEYFMYIALAVSIKSKDSHCRVGAVIVSPDKIVLSTGFNGLARGVHDDMRILLDKDEKLKVICHAEHNAIMNAARVGGHPLPGTTIYVTKFPCLACCNAIIQAGITRIYTHDHEFWEHDPFDKEQTRKPRVLHEAGVKVDAPYHPDFMPEKPITPPTEPLPKGLPVPPKSVRLAIRRSSTKQIA
jgi:dCMP deaminase